MQRKTVTDLVMLLMMIWKVKVTQMCQTLVTDTELAGSSAKMLSSPMRMNDAKLANVDDTELPDEDGEGLDRDSDIGDSADIGEEDVTVVGEEDVADLGDENVADLGDENVADLGDEEVVVLGDGDVLVDTAICALSLPGGCCSPSLDPLKSHPGLTEGCRILSLRKRMINVYQL